MHNNISAIAYVNRFPIGGKLFLPNRLRVMKRKPLSEPDKLAAANLRRIWDEKKLELGLTQDKAAEAMGFTTQGAVSHYLNGYLPINTDNLLKFAALLGVQPSAIRPDIGDLLGNALKRPAGSRVVNEFTAWLLEQMASGKLTDSDILLLRGRAELMAERAAIPHTISASEHRLKKSGRLSFVDRRKKDA